MLYSSFFTFTAAAVLSLQQVASATPLDVKFGDGHGSREDRQKIESAMPLVNQKLENMKAVIDLPNAQTHPAVVKALGAHANVDAIRQNIHTLQTSRIVVPHTDAADGVSQGATLTTKEGYKHVMFGSAFYGSDVNTHAGAIIHEATHAKANTVDHFKTDGTPGTRRDPGVRVGYKDSHMSELNAKHSDQMHHNTDACPNVVCRSLYRRAVEASHPVVRSELLRRAAHACAWKPKGKTAAAAAASASKSAAKGSRLGSQKSASAKKPLAAAKSVHKVSNKKSPFRTSGAKRPTKVKAAKPAHAGGAHPASKNLEGGWRQGAQRSGGSGDSGEA